MCMSEEAKAEMCEDQGGYQQIHRCIKEAETVLILAWFSLEGREEYGTLDHAWSHNLSGEGMETCEDLSSYRQAQVPYIILRPERMKLSEILTSPITIFCLSPDQKSLWKIVMSTSGKNQLI